MSRARARPRVPISDSEESEELSPPAPHRRIAFGRPRDEDEPPQEPTPQRSALKKTPVKDKTPQASGKFGVGAPKDRTGASFDAGSISVSIDEQLRGLVRVSSTLVSEQEGAIRRTEQNLKRAMDYMEQARGAEAESLARRATALKDEYASRYRALEQRFLEDVQRLGERLREALQADRARAEAALRERAADLSAALERTPPHAELVLRPYVPASVSLEPPRLYAEAILARGPHTPSRPPAPAGPPQPRASSSSPSRPRSAGRQKERHVSPARSSHGSLSRFVSAAEESAEWQLAGIDRDAGNEWKKKHMLRLVAQNPRAARLVRKAQFMQERATPAAAPPARPERSRSPPARPRSAFAVLFDELAEVGRRSAPRERPPPAEAEAAAPPREPVDWRRGEIRVSRKATRVVDILSASESESPEDD